MIVSYMTEQKLLISYKLSFICVIAFLFFGITAICDAIIELDRVTLIVIRVGLVIASTSFYIGFILPKWVRRLLSISEE